MEMNISKLAEMIASNSFLKNESYSSEELQHAVNYILEHVDVIGENNLHLRNPLNLDKSVPYFRKRETPLTGDEIVVGDFLLFDYTGHSEDMYLRQYRSLSEIEEQITNCAGITNLFTTYQVAIINGRVQEYDVYFTEKNDGQEYKFIKGLHDELPEHQSLFSKPKKPKKRKYEITKVRIVWRE